MIAIREFPVESDDASYAALARLLAGAYPIMGIDSAAKLDEVARETREFNDNPSARWVVGEDGDGLACGMKLYDYTMNVRGLDAPAGGVGAVAVALDRKRRGIARALIAWYLEWYRQRGTPFAILHAFRPDFYRKFGFGYGTPMHRYRFATSSLNAAGAHGRVRPLSVSDLDALLACCERVRRGTNGLIAKHRRPTERVLGELKPSYVGVEDGHELRGFMQTSVTLGAPGTANANELVVRDIHAEDAGAYAALLGYLAAQRDQFARVVIESQDDALYLAAEDPRDGTDATIAPPAAHRISETGLGIMYRLLDIPKAFAHLATGSRAAFVLKVDVRDEFFSPTNGSWTFEFSPGTVAEAPSSRVPDATLAIGIGDLGSLIVGSLDLRSLVRHRRAHLDKPSALATADELFRADAAPRCETRF